MAIPEAPAYPWYQVVEGANVTQGDIIFDCPLLVPDANDVLLRAVGGSDEKLTADVPVKKANLIVMTQACDIEHSKVNSVVLCPIWPLEGFSKDVPMLQSSKGREELRRGNSPAFHLLDKDADFDMDFQVVDFRELYSVPTEVLKLTASRAGKRPRLLSPYREQLSQSFARYFMRVGLPIDIPSFVK
jgi:hypothetical protein